jgi:sugar phosphate isomerase/epimerase
MTANDFPGALKMLGRLGYTGVEFAGHGSYKGAEMAKLLADNGLKSVSAHVGMEGLNDENYGATVEFHKAVGSKYIVCPFARMRDRDGALRCAEEFNAVAEKLAKDGFVFGYHNHAHEFSKDGSEHPLDVLIANTTDKVRIQLDLYWTAHAGIDSAAYMNKVKDRLDMLHLKQIENMDTKRCVDLPEGFLDYPALIKQALGLGVKEFILEQEEFAVSAEASLKNNIEFILGLE